MKQENQLGGSLRKGGHSEIVVFWKVDKIAKAVTDTGPESDEADKKSRRRFILRYYRLFNLEQCELPQVVLDKLPKIETHQHDPIEAAERIIAGMSNPPEIERVGSKAFYSSITDRITLPPRGLFIYAEEEIATRLHEYSHATGSGERLNRKSITEAAPFGSPTYSFEELVPEFSPTSLSPQSGISPVVLENQAAYVQGWLAKLRSDKRMVVIAAAQAQRAADYILDRTSSAESA